MFLSKKNRYCLYWTIFDLFMFAWYVSSLLSLFLFLDNFVLKYKELSNCQHIVNRVCYRIVVLECYLCITWRVLEIRLCCWSIYSRISFPVHFFCLFAQWCSSSYFHFSKSLATQLPDELYFYILYFWWFCHRLSPCRIRL